VLSTRRGRLDEGQQDAGVLVGLSAHSRLTSGAKGWPDGACVPAVNLCTPGCAPTCKPWSFHSVASSRVQFFAFLSIPYFTPTQANFLALVAPKGRILEANFQKFSGADSPGPSLVA